MEWAWNPKEQESSGSSASEEEPGLREMGSIHVLKRSFPRGEITSSSEVLFYPHRQALKTSNIIL